MSTPIGQDRPRVDAPEFENLPSKLRPFEQWVVWRFEPKAGKSAETAWTKVPYDPKTGNKASTTASTTWADFATARSAYEASTGSEHEYSGVGFVLTPEDPFAIVDLDRLDKPEAWAWAEDIAVELDSYTELSVSREGLHIIVEAELPEGRRRSGRLEMYDSGRYFALTGWVREGEPWEVQRRQEAVSSLHQSLGATTKTQRSVQPASSPIADDEILHLARSAASGRPFVALFDQGDLSDYGGDQSAADLALANKLIWWANHDVEQADRLFRRSALMRPKWDEPHYGDGETYGAHTLALADEEVDGGYYKDDLPSIIINGRQLRDIVGDAAAAVARCNTPEPSFFDHHGQLVEVSDDGSGDLKIRHSSESDVTLLLSKAANWFTQSGGRRAGAMPPAQVVRAMRTPQPGCYPVLNGISSIPVLRKDGSVLAQSGYDRESGIYLALTAEMEAVEVADVPSREQLDAARNVLGDIFTDFPFVDEASSTNVIALLLSGVVRSSFQGPIPLALIDKTAPGSGATLLAQVVGLVHTGASPAVLTVPVSDPELEKRLASVLMTGQSVIVLDNVDVPLEHGTLAAILTSESYSYRLLGRNQIVELSTPATWIATGNNIQVRGDIARRCYYIRLSPEVSMPWGRVGFKIPNLREYIRENRADIVRALLTLARHWYASGRPTRDVPRLGMFEGWTATIGGILANAGYQHFLGNLQDIYAFVDGQDGEWAAFLRVVHELTFGKPFGAAELHQMLAEDTDVWSQFPTQVVEAMTGEGKPAMRLGRLFSKQRGRVFGPGLSLQPAGTSARNSALWVVAAREEAAAA